MVPIEPELVESSSGKIQEKVEPIPMREKEERTSLFKSSSVCSNSSRFG
jgi:hypothetical protein